MNNISKYVIEICLILILFCCNKKSIDEKINICKIPTVNITTVLDSVITITNWLAIGPFEFQPLLTDPAETFFRKDLKQYGIKEGFIDEVAVEKLQMHGGKAFVIDVQSPPIDLFNYFTQDIEKTSNFYLVTRINSTCKQEISLITDGSSSYAIWINGDKLIEVRGKHNTNKVGDRFINVSLNNSSL